jgi:hypothetical protein
MATPRRRGGNKNPQIPTIPPSFSEDVSINLAGMGDLLHVVYRVTEETTAIGPFYVQDEATGTICKLVGVPKIGALTSKKTEVGNYGFAVFFNPNNAVNYSSKVTFVAGALRREHLPVF